MNDPSIAELFTEAETSPIVLELGVLCSLGELIEFWMVSSLTVCSLLLKASLDCTKSSGSDYEKSVQKSPGVTISPGMSHKFALSPIWRLNTHKW